MLDPMLYYFLIVLFFMVMTCSRLVNAILLLVSTPQWMFISSFMLAHQRLVIFSCLSVCSLRGVHRCFSLPATCVIYCPVINFFCDFFYFYVRRVLSRFLIQLLCFLVDAILDLPPSPQVNLIPQFLPTRQHTQFSSLFPMESS